MTKVQISIDRSDPKGPVVTVGVPQGTDATSFELAKPKVLAVLEALGLKGVKFVMLSEVEQHNHADNALVVAQHHVHHG